MATIIVPVGNQYVKKDDAPQFFKNHKRGLVVTSIFVPLPTLFVVMIFVVGLIKISELGHSFLPYVFLGTPIVLLSAVLYLAIVLPLVFSKDYETNFFDKLKSYKDGEMINIKDLIDQKRLTKALYVWLGLFLLGCVFYVIPFFLL